MSFFTILIIPNLSIIYCHVKCLKKFKYHLDLYTKNNTAQKKITLIYSSESDKIVYNSSTINLFYSKINFEPVLFKHNQKHSRLSHLKIDEANLEIYDTLVRYNFQNLVECANKINRKANPIIEQGVQESKKLLSQKFCQNTQETDLTIQEFANFLLAVFHKDIPVVNYIKNNFLLYVTYYTFPITSILRNPTNYNTVYLENVFYKNKNFFNTEGVKLSEEDLAVFANDIEYAKFNKKDFNINTGNCFTISEPVLFLDYIYNFYNFGEFWDIVQRLIFFEKIEPVELYTLINHRISDIKTYFDCVGFNFPGKYINNIKWNDFSSENAVFFKKVYFSLINNTCRGALNRWAAYEMNKLYNFYTPSDEEYNLYLVRGKMARGILEEKDIIETFEKKYNFKILDGSETLEEQKHYFTNASFIIGAHSSLMKNIVWCKKNPVFVEMCPASRTHMCFYGNAKELGFPAIILPFLCNEKEEIIITAEQRKNLYSLIELFL